MKNKIVDGFNHLTGRHGFDYSQITKNIFLGTNMCCQFGFAKELLSKGIRADISLEDDHVDAPNGVDYFLWLPTMDGEAPIAQKLELGVQALKFFAEQDIKVYIHCKNGHGRAPTLLAAYLKSTGTSVDDALNLIKKGRPAVHLTAAQREALARE